jgi:two-component sensor histidine kinase
MLMTIRAVAKLTRAKSASLDEFVKSLDDRLTALARNHDLFSQAGRIDATISELLVQQLSPQGAVEGENFSQAGPEIIHSE